MNRYKYKACDQQGNVQKGIIEAKALPDVLSQLKAQGFYPISISRQKNFKPANPVSSTSRKPRRIPSSEMAQFCYQLATLLAAGVPLIGSLDAIISQLKNKEFQRVLKEIRDNVGKGMALSNAMSQYPKIFTMLFISLIKAGEESGNLDAILVDYTKFLETKEEMHKEIKNAMVYPVFLLVMAVAVVIFLMVVILPKFINILNDANVKLPLPTYILIKSSQFLQQNFVWVTTVLVLIIFSIKWFLHTEKGRYLWDATKLKIPLIGDLIYKFALIRFAKVSSILLSSGIALLQNLELVKDIVNNRIFKKKITLIQQRVAQGNNLAREIAAVGFFPPLFIRMVRVGEETGQLESMMEKISNYYEKEVSYRIKRLLAALEPTLLVTMALMVGFIALSLVMALMRVLGTLK